MTASAGSHVLLVVENLSVPFDRRVWREARALRRRGYAVSVICPRGRGYDKEPFVELEGVRIHRYPLPVEGVSSPERFSVGLFLLEYTMALVASLLLAIRIYVRRPFHVIHAANPPDLFFVLALVFRPFGVRFVFDVHDLNPEAYLAKRSVPRKDLFYRVLVLAERVSVWTADLVIATNESYRRILAERDGRPLGQIVVVRNGPELHHFRPVPVSPELHEGYQYLVAYVGVMAKLDGLDYLLQAVHHTVHECHRRDVLFVLMGDGTAVPELKGLARALDVEPFVRFTGRVPDEALIRYLSAADVCVAPDPRNSMNDISTMNKIMDYMAFGKPIVSFDLTESRFSADEAAVYVPHNDARAFGKAVLALLDNPGEREHRAAIARERVHLLAWEHSEASLLSAYERLVPQVPSPTEVAVRR